MVVPRDLRRGRWWPRATQDERARSRSRCKRRSTIATTDLALGARPADARRSSRCGATTSSVIWRSMSADVRCELAPLGWALCRSRLPRARDPRHAARGVDGGAVQAAAAGDAKPIHTDRLVIDDAELVFSPSAIMPNLGRVEITIEHAESPARRCFARRCRGCSRSRSCARASSCPRASRCTCAIANGKLSAAGTLFGSAPVEVPFALPLAEAAQDAHEEMHAAREGRRGCRGAAGRAARRGLAAREVEVASAASSYCAQASCTPLAHAFSRR